MLTDRQQKFYNQISALASPTSPATDEERKYLSKAKLRIEKGQKFSETINSLDFALLGFSSQQADLSPDVSLLFDTLKKAYGEPGLTFQKSEDTQSEKEKPWLHDEKLGIKFTVSGTGKGGGWREETSDKTKPRDKHPVWKVLEIWALTLLIGALGITLLFTSSFQILSKKFGNFGLLELGIGVLLIVMVVLIITGRFKKKKSPDEK